MKCQEVNRLLVVYLDDEVTPSERTLIRAHLAGCDTCQQELAAPSALHSRVSQFLQIRGAQAGPLGSGVW
jgi:anti-sigma factor RsiW